MSIGLAVWYGGMNAATGGTVTVGELTAIIIFIGMLFDHFVNWLTDSTPCRWYGCLGTCPKVAR